MWLAACSGLKGAAMAEQAQSPNAPAASASPAHSSLRRCSPGDWRSSPRAGSSSQRPANITARIRPPQHCQYRKNQLIPSVLGPPASATARGGPSFEPAREPIFDRSLPYVPPRQRARETRRSGGRPRNGRNACGTWRSRATCGRRRTSPSPNPNPASSHTPAIR